MKKILSLLILFTLNTLVFAEVTIFNMSQEESVEVIYRFCEDHQMPHKMCSQPYQVSIIPVSKRTTSAANSVTLTPPTTSTVIVIDKATEFDSEFGNAVSQGVFTNGLTQGCTSKLADQNVAFILSDHNSPVITCFKSAY